MQQQIYIAIAIGALAVIVILTIFFRKRTPQARLSPLAAVAVVFVIAGLVLGDSRIVGYSLMGVGILFALIDIIYKLKK